MKILAGCDGSGTSEKVMEVAILHAKAFDAEIKLVTSIVSGDEKNMEQIDETKRRLEYAEEILTKSGVRCDTHLLIRGLFPGEDIGQFVLEI